MSSEIYVGTCYDPENTNIVAYSLLVRRENIDKGFKFDVIYGVCDDSEYIELDKLSGHIFAIASGLRLFGNYKDIIPLHDGITIYHNNLKLIPYVLISSNPRKPILQYFVEYINYNRSLYPLDFYYIDSKDNDIIGMANNWAKAALFFYYSNKSSRGFERNLEYKKG